MSEPQQPPVPPSAQPSPAFPPAPPAPHLPAAPQYPAAAPQYPAATPQYPTAAPQPPQAAAPQQYQAQQQPTAPQPPYGQQSYGQHSHPQQPYGQQRRSAAGPGNPLARTAFIVALVVAAVGALQVLLQPFVLASFSYDAGNFGVFSFLFGVIIFLGSAAALVLGLIAIRRPGGQVLAGIAIGVGGVQLFGIVLGWMSSLFFNFL